MADRLPEQLRAALEGTYAVERELGGAGMSRVFRAQETALGRAVVIKVLAHTGAAGIDAERFRREILQTARLQHPNIVPVLTAGDVDGLPYFVMPFVEGESLRERLREHGALPLGEVVRLLRDVAAALAYAHERGVVHRDIKPDNVMVSGGVGVVLDFGVSKALAESREGRSSITSAGIAVGTPAYMAPEQAAGDPAVDQRADLYALGVLAYELLTATTPFGGRDPHQVLRAHLLEEPPPVRTRRADVPPELAALVMQCLAKSPGDRPASAGAILERLDAAAVSAAGRRGARVEPWTERLGSTLGPPVAWVVLAAVAMAGLERLGSRSLASPRLVVAGFVLAILGLPVVIALAQLRRVSVAEGAVKGGWGRWVAAALAAVLLLGSGGVVLAQRGGAAAAADERGTASPDAARDFADAARRAAAGDTTGALALLRAALVRDTSYALAWRALGLLLAAGGDTVQAREALTRAWDLREHLSDRERLLTVAAYYRHVSRERERAITAYGVYLDLVPADSTARRALTALESGRGS